MVRVKYEDEVRDGIKAGVDLLADAVKITLGPKGRNVIIEQEHPLDPKVTKDGVTVAKEFELTDPIQNMGATLVKRVAESSNDLAGDGTTTATVLAQEILKEGIKLVKAGFNPLDIKKGIDMASQVIVAKLNEMSIPVAHDSESIVNVATVSANNDPELGAIIAEAFSSVGIDGAVSVEEGGGYETEIDIVDGLQFDRGLISTFLTTNPDKIEMNLRDALILVVDGKMTTADEVMHTLQPVAGKGKPLFIIAEDITGQALSTIVMNKTRGGIQIGAVKAPGFGEYRKELLHDIAAIVGAEVIKPEGLLDVDVFQLGKAEVVSSTTLSTIIMGGDKNPEKVEKRLFRINEKMNDKKLTTYEKDKLAERKAKLSGGVAMIKVGAKSEVDMKEKKDRVDDAKEAVISAIEEGIVLGGGMALLNCRNIPIVCDPDTDEAMGVSVMMNAIKAPFMTICSNAKVNGDVILKEIEDAKNLGELENIGYNAKTGKIVDMISEGIVDPKKVTRVAVESAASVIGTILTTECALIRER